MKKSSLPKLIPLLTLCAGIAGCALQLIFRTAGTDEKGLLVSSHWADTASWILTALVIAALALCIRGLGGTPRYSQLFPASLTGAAGCLAGAVGIASVSIRTLVSAPSTLNTAVAVLGFVAAACLLVRAYYRWKGTRPATLLHIPVILFFLIDALLQYRSWSSATQLQEYAFPAFAAILLLLACYHRATLEVKMTGRKSYVFFSYAAAFFCCLIIFADVLFYLPMAVWMLADCCSLKVLQAQRTQVSENEGE